MIKTYWKLDPHLIGSLDSSSATMCPCKPNLTRLISHFLQDQVGSVGLGNQNALSDTFNTFFEKSNWPQMHSTEGRGQMCTSGVR